MNRRGRSSTVNCREPVPSVAGPESRRLRRRWRVSPTTRFSPSTRAVLRDLATLPNLIIDSCIYKVQDLSAMAANTVSQNGDELAEALNELFTNVSSMVKGDLQGTNNLLELLEKMNLKVAEEYKGFGDVASGLRVFVEQLKSKSGNFDEYVQQIDAIEQQVTEFEAIISMLDKYVTLLESKVQSVYRMPPSQT